MTSTDQTPLRLSDDDIRVAMAVLAQVPADEVASLVTLTDEEILALEGLGHEQLTALPWVEENAAQDAQRALVTAAAMRSFLARGLVVSEDVTDPREDSARAPRAEGERTYEAAPELRATAVLRRTSDAVVAMGRRTDHGTATSMFYVFDLPEGRRALWEVYDAQGFHLFFLVPDALLIDQMIAFADPQGVVGTVDGDPEEVPAEELTESETGRRLAQARAATSVLVARRDLDAPVTCSVFGLPDHLELMEAAAAGGVIHQRVGMVSRDSLAQMLSSLLPAGAAEDADG